MVSDSRQSAYQYLLSLSEQQGYILFDDIMSCADRWALPIQDVDWLSNSITTRGILVYDVVPSSGGAGSNDGDEGFDDFAQSDYDAVFDKVIKLDSELEDFITAIRNIRPPQAREMNRLKYQIQEGNTYARQRVIEMHLRFAVRIALQRVEAYDLEMADTLQEACVGLIYAVDRYDPDSSGPFGSYASLWIMQNLNRTQPTKRPLVYYPYHRKEDYFAVYPVLKSHGCLACSKILECQKVRKLIRDTVNCPNKQIDDIINQLMPVESFNDLSAIFFKSIGDEEKHENSDEPEEYYKPVKYNALIKYIHQDTEFDYIYGESLHDTINEVVGELKPREQEVIRARYGLDSGEEKTLENVGTTFGVTRERIRQIEAKTLRKLRHPSCSKKLKDFLD